MTLTPEQISETLAKHAAWLSGQADGVRAELRRAELGGANLYGADLRRAELYGANLYGANLGGANLYGANLYGAELGGANLYGANLYGAELRRAELGGADLRRAELGGADLGTIIIIQIGQIGSRNDQLIYVRDGVYEQLRAGCWTGTLDEFEARVVEVHGENIHGQAYRAAIAYIREIVRLRTVALWFEARG